MENVLLYGLFLFSFNNINGQELFAISPINYPKTESQILENGSVLFENFDITLSKNQELFYKDELIYKCDFTEYYEYLIEIFVNERNYLIVSPLPKTHSKGIATPYNIDRGIVLIFDYHNNKKYYANLDTIKWIEISKSFEFAKNKSHAFMIKNIDGDKKELILLQGGVEIKEVIIKLYEF